MNGGVSPAKPLTKWLLAAKGTRGQISRDDAQETLCDISRWEQMHMVRAGNFWFLANQGSIVKATNDR